MNIFNALKAIFNTILLYGVAFFASMTPGTVIWKLFKTRKGKVRLICRDLICDAETLINLPKAGDSLDELTNAFCPFLALFLLNQNDHWKQRRDVFVDGNNKIYARLIETTLNITLPSKRGTILWDLYEIMFRIGFELVYGRPPTAEEYNDMYPGLVDINKVIKRFSWSSDLKIRQKLYDCIVKLVEANDKNFIFHNHEGFQKLNELDKVSVLAEDIIATICIQCTDLLCHMLLLYTEHSDDFHTNLDNCINETLRLYPLSDLWVGQPTKDHRGWITSLVQLNRNGWSDPDTFLPERWNSREHPPLMSWGYNVRRCPGQKVGTLLVKLVFKTITEKDGFWIQPASNFDHERTFPYGCQVWIGYGKKPDNVATWTFNNKFKMLIRRWIYERLRMFDQNELN